MIRRALALAVAIPLALPLTACSLKAANRVGTIVTASLLACDYGNTTWHARRGWTHEDRGDRILESNPVLGPMPSPAAVGGYFVAVSALVLGGTMLLPEHVQPGVHAALAVVQTFAAYQHYETGAPVCGVL